MAKQHFRYSKKSHATGTKAVFLGNKSKRLATLMALHLSTDCRTNEDLKEKNYLLRSLSADSLSAPPFKVKIKLLHGIDVQH